MDLSLLFSNLLTPPILFFFLGILACLLRSDLEIPQPLPKFFSLYLNAPASRLKKSCRGVKSILRSWSSHPVSVFGVCRWKRSELSGRGLNGKTAWVRSGCQIWHRPFNTTIILSGPLFGRRLHGDSTWTIYSGGRKGRTKKLPVGNSATM